MYIGCDNMKKENKKRQARKEIPTALLVILSILYSVLLVLLGICIGFLINAIVNYSLLDILANLIITLLVGIVSLILHIRLMCNSDSENKEPLKWYINNVFIALIISLILTALTVGILGAENDSDINILIGTLMFPLLGIISTPNVIKYSLNDMSKWKNVLYKHGNLHQVKKSKDYYKMDTPLPFEKKLLHALHKEEFLNVLVVVVVMLIVIIIGVHYMVTDHSYTDNLFQNILIMRARKAFGMVFFLMIIFIVFGIPIIAYYLCNAIKRSRVIRKHEYIAYHAIVSGASNGIAIYNNNTHYQYKYAIYVGIKAKDIHNTPATLVFIPDYVIVISDNKE